ncbi:MAG: glycosyltransferase [Ilumatobacteraceae bacterium]
MKLLIVSPDYASHVDPMLQIGIEWQRELGPCIVATGPSVRSSVERHGLGWTMLQLGRGSNAGVIRADEQPVGEDDHLREFFAATRGGAVETLRYQAIARRQDLLFEPERVLADLGRIIDAVAPDRVLVDHVAFGARLALYALGVDAASIVLGHPTACPAEGELYGLPSVWPNSVRQAPDKLAELTAICAASTADLAQASNDLLDRLAPDRPRLSDLTSLPGSPTLYMYPQKLHDSDRRLPADSVSLGSLRRQDVIDPATLPTGGGPLVVVALGTFLSARDDVLKTAVQAAHLGGWRLALASGSTPIESLGPLPDGALVAEHLAQVALLEHADVLVTHGGNNSVTEACAAGVPMVVLPMSTDQFAGAAAIERTGLGIVLDPNDLSAADLVDAVNSVLTSDAGRRAKAVADAIARDGGPSRAVRAISRW